MNSAFIFQKMWFITLFISHTYFHALYLKMLLKCFDIIYNWIGGCTNCVISDLAD